MSATYQQLAYIANAADFQSRVAFAMSNAAGQVFSESTSVTGHAQRATYATSVLNGSYNLAAAALGVVTSSTIISEATVTSSAEYDIADTDIQNQVNGLWNAFSGA